MKRVQRQDVGTISKIEATPQGGIALDGFITRTGVFVYHDESGKEIREWRPAEEVFRDHSLRTLLDAPFTLNHPTELVTPQNWRKYSSGHIQAGSVREDAGKVAGRFIVQDAPTIEAVRSGKYKEVSAGYTAEIDATPGVTPDGERYDQIQRNIVYNHVAAVRKGRAGSEISLRLDSAGNQFLDTPSEVVLDSKGGQEPKGDFMKMRIDGIDFPLGSEAEVKAALNALERHDAKRADEVKTLTGERDSAKGRADAADAKVKELETKLTAAEDPKRFDAAVSERINLLERAKAVLGNEKVEGTPREIMTKVIEKAQPAIKLDGQSDEYVRAVFDTLSVAKASAAQQILRTDATAPTGNSPLDVAKAKHAERIKAAGTAPLGATK